MKRETAIKKIDAVYRWWTYDALFEPDYDRGPVKFVATLAGEPMEWATDPQVDRDFWFAAIVTRLRNLVGHRTFDAITKNSYPDMYSEATHRREAGRAQAMWLEPQQVMESESRFAERKMERFRKNPDHLFVNIVFPDGEERAVRCGSEVECGKVIRIEAGRASPFTLFIVVGEEDGKIVPLDRWGVDKDGWLRHHPYGRRTKERREAHTVPATTRRMAR